jgi:single-stranded DNA-binding protein
MVNDITVQGKIVNVGNRLYTVGGDCVADVRMCEVLERTTRGETKVTKQYFKFRVWDEDLINDLEFAGKDALVSVSGEFMAKFWMDEYKQRQVVFYIDNASVKILEYVRNGETKSWAEYEAKRRADSAVTHAVKSQDAANKQQLETTNNEHDTEAEMKQWADEFIAKHRRIDELTSALGL